MKRLCVFFFYDHQGIVDEYVEVLLDGMKKSVDKFVIVCNGVLKPEGRRIFRKFTDTVIVRENKGLDVWAYKTAIDFLGWEEICRYDEFIMMNHTICGPLFPFEDMFAQMDSSDVDFWGISMYYGGYKRPADWPDNGYEYVQDHIQSHFIAVRRHMFRSHEFRKYWDEVPLVEKYTDSMSLHESVFTKKFSDMGFTYCSYIDCCDEAAYDLYPLMFDSHVLIRKKKCPIIKKKRNVYPFPSLMTHDFNYELRDMVNAVSEYTDYNIDMVYKNTLRTSILYDFQRGSLVDFILSGKGKTECRSIDKKKTGIILNINNFDIFKDFKDYLNRILPGFEVVVIADKNDGVDEYLASDVKIVKMYKFESSVQMLAALEEQLNKYEYLFVLSFDTLNKHFQKSFDYNTLLMEFDSLFESADQVNYAADAFENNSILGVLAPLVHVAGAGLNELNDYRIQHFECVSRYAEFIDVLHSKENHYCFPANNIFACKAEAVKGFVESLMKCFGSIDDLPYDLLLPLYAQSRGYYTARIMTEYNAKVHLAILEDLLYTKGVLK